MSTLANKTWRGDAQATAQVDIASLGSYDAATHYGVEINGKLVEVIAAGSLNATIDALALALNSTAIPEFREISWTSDGAGTLTMTANTPGTPFTYALTLRGGGGNWDGFSEITANKSPNDWTDPDNWVEGAIPVPGDEVLFANSSSSVFWNISHSTLALYSLTFEQSYTGQIGLPRYNPNGYYEYRDTYLYLNPGTLNIGQGQGQGCSRLKLRTKSTITAPTINVYASGTPADQNIPAIMLWLDNSTGGALNLQSGSVGLGWEPDTYGFVDTLKMGYLTNQASDANVYCGALATITTLNQNGGTVFNQQGLTTFNQYGGTYTQVGTGGIATMNQQAGTIYYRSNGTITAGTIGSKGKFLHTQDPRGFTITNLTLAGGATWLDPFGTVTYSNAMLLQNCTLDDVTLDIGFNRHLSPS